MRVMRMRFAAALAAVGLVATLAACTAEADGRAGSAVEASALGDDQITVASFNFPESRLLAEIYGQALRAAGFAVDIQLDLGPRELVDPALAKGLVELVPEYAGTATHFLSVGEVEPTADVASTHDALERALRSTAVAALAPAEAQNTNAFVVTRATAKRHGLRELSDLQAVDGQLSFGGPPECPARPLCLQGLEDVYRLRFREFVALDAGGPISLQALLDGQVDVTLRFSTDSSIRSNGLVVLGDDRNLQPAENVTPIVHRDALRRFGPDLAAAVDAVSERLTTHQLGSLNTLLAADETKLGRVASVWLSAEGLA